MSEPDSRPAVVGYITARWQEQDEVADAIIWDLQRHTSEQGGSAYDATLDVLACMADMVITIVSCTARSLGLDRERLIGDTLKAFGRVAAGEENPQ